MQDKTTAELFVSWMNTQLSDDKKAVIEDALRTGIEEEKRRKADEYCLKAYEEEYKQYKEQALHERFRDWCRDEADLFKRMPREEADLWS